MSLLFKSLFVVLVFLLSTGKKYLPGVYTARWLWIILKYLKLIKPKAEGVENPFVEFTRTTRCSWLECDIFGFHKNNATYFTELDLARTETFMFALHRYFYNEYQNGKIAFIPLATVQAHFLKELKTFQKYYIRTRIVGWGDKWIYLITIFTIPEPERTVDAQYQPIKVLQDIPPLYHHLDNDNPKRSHTERVLCLSVAKLIFKNGRQTIQPWDIIQRSCSSSASSTLTSAVNEYAHDVESKIGNYSQNVVELLKIYENSPSQLSENFVAKLKL
ncbi:Protein THEM6 [Pichia kudriavzevii]|uniref:Protein THEM6 n=1 Tax=Pichia kudriavzevii TaxID=4909 RepID=A0A1V2LPW4_PICKU|nr:Protein THEM6 [Pichia kudriavzevii]